MILTSSSYSEHRRHMQQLSNPKDAPVQEPPDSKPERKEPPTPPPIDKPPAPRPPPPAKFLQAPIRKTLVRRLQVYPMCQSFNVSSPAPEIAV